MFKNILKLFPIVLGILIVFFAGASLLFMGFFAVFSKVTELTNDLFPQYASQDWFAFVFILEFVALAAICIFTIYLIIRTSYLIGAKKLFTIRNSVDKSVSKTFAIDNLDRIMFEYKLRSPDRTWKQVLRNEPNEDVLAYIKSKYPEFKPKAKWEPGAGTHNFIEAIELLEKLDINEVNEEIPLFKESIRITIKNLDTGKKLSRLLEPTHQPFSISRPFFSLNKKQFEVINNGKNFEIRIAYKGTKGYNLDIWIK